MFRLIQILKFLLTVKGVLLLAVVIAVVYGLIKSDGSAKDSDPKQENSTVHQIYTQSSSDSKEPPVSTYHRQTSPGKTLVAPKSQILTRTIIQTPENGVQGTSERQLPVILNIYNKLRQSSEEDPEHEPAIEAYVPKPKEPVPPAYAPFGRMIKCELVNAVDSNNRETPIIGLVMEPVYWAGELIIPAGSEIHGIAGADNVRDRICSGNRWNIVLCGGEENRPSGMVLTVDGVALDAENFSGDGKDFGLTDGSFGIRGVRIKSNELEEAKVFAATFLGAVTGGLQNQVPTGSILGGTKTDNTVRDASLGGLTSVMSKVADRIEKDIDGNGHYTRCHAGKQFYLYVQQSINPEDWSMGASLKTESEEKELSLENAEGLVEKISYIKSMLNQI